jgi:hypothetical protein
MSKLSESAAPIRDTIDGRELITAAPETVTGTLQSTKERRHNREMPRFTIKEKVIIDMDTGERLSTLEDFLHKLNDLNALADCLAEPEPLDSDNIETLLLY